VGQNWQKGKDSGKKVESKGQWGRRQKGNASGTEIETNLKNVL